MVSIEFFQDSLYSSSKALASVSYTCVEAKSDYTET